MDALLFFPLTFFSEIVISHFHLKNEDMKRTILISFLSICLSLNIIRAQKTDVYNLFPEFIKLHNSGDFIGAEKCMLTVLDPANSSPSGYLYAAYNNLGMVKKSLGLYAEALSYYDKAEKLFMNDKKPLNDLARIYCNKARIYTFQKSFSTAIDFLEKAIRIYKTDENPTESSLQGMSTAYLNLGIVFYESGNYENALENMEESLRLKKKYNLPEIELTYLNLAKIYAKIGSFDNAEDFFLKSINSMKSQFGEDYYRITEVYFGYGTFLNETGKPQEALKAHKEALMICRNNYGEKHTLVALSYKNLGDHFLKQSLYRTALENYQKSLIAVVNSFNDTSIYSNPSIDSSLFNIRLLESLKSKSTALELLSGVQNDPSQKLRTLNNSLGTIELALKLIDRIRNDYLTEDSRIYLAENEKETYLSAIHTAKALYDLTGESSFVRRMYETAAKAKSAVLRDEITENELLWSAGIPDSLNRKQASLSVNIAAYNDQVLKESQKKEPDSNKISLWKDDLFEMNREKEKLTALMNNEFPQIRELLQKTEPLPLAEIQKHLNKDETIIDYLLSNKYNDGKRDLYTFLITRDSIKFILCSLDSLFLKNAEIIRDHTLNNEFGNYTGALYYMYGSLLKPAEGSFSGNKLIIIPDEEIAWLPFDAFLMSPPGKDQTDYESLSYLINKYSISYGYSSSLISGRSDRLKRGEKVYSFSPDYGNGDQSGETLYGAGKEIESIYKWFRGSKFTGSLATETNFRQAIQNPAIFHLAMHSVTDSVNSKYSFLVFDSGADTIEDGRLYNYEISLARMISPMVVLSACNSGTGTLFHGEGLMSMARGFILAGASSVVRTSWEVNDETSAGIIISFYHYLSRGMNKNDALRQAKLDHLAGSTPALSDPWYWAAYEVLGDTVPVARNKSVLILVIIAAIILAGAMAFYLRRRRIFSERSE